MVLVGRRYWTEEMPAWPLLRELARGRPMEERVHLVDGVAEAVELLTSPIRLLGTRRTRVQAWVTRTGSRSTSTSTTW